MPSPSRYQFLIESLKNHGDSEECLLWPYGITRRGDTEIRIQTSRGSEAKKVHRLAWELEHGLIPFGRGLLQTCQVKTCYNPKHLLLKSGITKYDLFVQALERHGNSDECLVWPYSRSGPNGYGKVTYQSTRLFVHRAAWELIHGPIPDGLWVLHSCDNRPCFNARRHLFLGDNADNVNDCIAKGRGNRTMGERHQNAKLKDEDVIRIRELYAEGGYTQRRLGLMYGVCHQVILQLLHRDTWKHLP